MTDARDIPFLVGEPFEGLTHAEVLALELPADERYLVEDLIPAGAVGTIAGVPETHKSFLAQAIAVRVASGSGEVLGRPVLTSGRVGYVWQDDSRREEIERVRLFEHAHPSPSDLSLWWFLNVGLSLPTDLERLRATVEHHQLGLLILDSFYSVVFGIDLKDSEAEQIIVLLKREIADPTGCTVLIVDHMPWATDSNRGRLRGYGGVHKGAAIRFGIYIDAEGKNLYVEARGNNIKGFKKTPAYWDEDALELRLVDVKHVNEAELDERVIGYLSEHDWSSGNAVEKHVTGGGKSIRESLLRLEEARRITKRSATELGRTGRGNYWNVQPDAPSEFVSLFETNLDEPMPGDVTNKEVRPFVPPPTGDEPPRDEPRLPLNDDLAVHGRSA